MNYLERCMLFRSRLLWKVWNLGAPGGPTRWELVTTAAPCPTEDDLSPAHGLGRLRYRYASRSSDPVRALIRRTLVEGRE
jgi:hypothetical protein